jgi:hypothetical protein
VLPKSFKFSAGVFDVLEIIIKNPPFPHHRTRKKRLFSICLMKRDAKCEPQTLSFVPWTTPRPTGTRYPYRHHEHIFTLQKFYCADFSTVLLYP